MVKNIYILYTYYKKINILIIIINYLLKINYY